MTKSSLILIFLSLASYSGLKADELRFEAGPLTGNAVRKVVGFSYTKTFKTLPFIIEPSTYLMPRDLLDKDYIIAPAVSFGLELKPANNLYIHCTQGVSYISKTAPGLASNYQLITKLSGGLWKDNYFLGVSYIHLSNGQVSFSNTGLTSFGLEAGLSL